VQTAASQAEMEAGTETAIRSMTPQRVAQAIAALQYKTEVLTWDFAMSDGSDLTSGAGTPLTCRFAGTIASWRILLDASGTIEFDLRKDTYANFPPTAPDSIVASAPPETSSAIATESSTLTGWTTALAAGDVIVPHITAGGTDIKKARLELTVTRS